MRSLKFAVSTGLCALALLACTVALSGCGSGVAGSAAAPKAISSGAQLGYFWNASDQTLRPVLGIAGASQVGASVVPAGEYIFGGASAASSMALLQAADGSLDVMQLPSGQPVHLAAATSAGSVIRFSPSGTAAVVFAPGGLSVTVVTKLTGSPQTAVLPAPAAVQDAVSSDTGNAVLAVAVSSGAPQPSNGTQLITGKTGAQLAALRQYGGMSFSAGDSLVYADAAANTVSLIQNEATVAVVRELPSLSLLKTPGAVAVSSSGQWVVVANVADPSMVRLDLTAQSPALSIACSCTPTNAVPLAGNSFRVTDPGSGPLWAVDAGLPAPRVFFIPAIPAPAKGAH